MPATAQIQLTGKLILSRPEKDGSRAIIIDTSDGDVYIIPMDSGTCQNIGKDLSAPHVEVARVMPK